MTDRGPVKSVRAVATIAGLPRDIAERELKLAGRLLELRPDQLVVDELPGDQGPGNVFTVEVESASGTEVFTAFGQRGVRAEEVARDAARQAKHFLDHDVPVGEHLADQLLLPMALARGGAYVTDELSLHATTNVGTIGKFLDVRIEAREVGRRRIEVRVCA
jgi:RNA 3'-terminal phosphate cyclase (ATP)